LLEENIITSVFNTNLCLIYQLKDANDSKFVNKILKQSFKLLRLCTDKEDELIKSGEITRLVNSAGQRLVRLAVDKMNISSGNVNAERSTRQVAFIELDLDLAELTRRGTGKTANMGLGSIAINRLRTVLADRTEFELARYQILVDKLDSKEKSVLDTSISGFNPSGAQIRVPAFVNDAVYSISLEQGRRPPQEAKGHNFGLVAVADKPIPDAEGVNLKVFESSLED
jgi:hypothetical protein